MADLEGAIEMQPNSAVLGENGDANCEMEALKPSSGPNKDAIKHQTKNVHQAGFKFENCYLTILSISIFSSLGCMIRVGLDHAVGGELANIENPSSVLFKSFYSNMFGSFMIGVLHALPLHHTTVLYIGIGTGLCGSVTTYSKWNQQVSMMLVGAEYVQSQAQLVALSAIIVGLTSFVCSYQFGKDLFRTHTKKPQYKVNVMALKISLWVAFVVLYSTLACITWYYWTTIPFVASLCLSAIMGPPGALGRYFLSVHTPPFRCKGKLTVLNTFPTGTLLANTIGSCIVALSVVLESWVRLSCSGRIALMAFTGGLLASFTTVSSLVGEIVRIRANERRLAGYLYSFVTVFLCLSLASFINGINHHLLMEHFYALPASQNETFYQWKATFQPGCSL